MTPVDIRGTIYRSIAAASRALSVNVKTVERHLNAGTPDLIGLTPHAETRACEFDGIKYPSLGAAARALGVSVQAVSQRVKRLERNQRKLVA